MRGRWYQNGRGRTHRACGWGRFRGISRGGGLHTTDTRAPALPDAGEPNCVRPMNHVYARAFVRGEGRWREGREALVRDTLRSRCNPGDTGWEDTGLGIPMRHSKGVARLPGQLSRLIKIINYALIERGNNL